MFVFKCLIVYSFCQDQVHQSIPWKKGTVNGLGMVNLNLENLKKAITTEHLHAEIKVTKAQTAQVKKKKKKHLLYFISLLCLLFFNF